MRNVMIAVSMLALAAGSTACASKKYVNTRVGEVNDRVSTLARSLEETQERTRQNEQRIGEVDQKAEAANQKAAEAGSAAAAARAAASEAEAKAEAVDRAQRRLVYEVVLTDEKSKFAFGRATLTDEAKAEIDRLVQQLMADPKHLYIEIEGHTDAVGPASVNERLGLERAEAVKRYLYEEHNIPLHKINVISYGERKPVAPNNTRQGRAQNRRVVIKVLA
jgi:peptidoglycan-associated lipoprotein